MQRDVLNQAAVAEADIIGTQARAPANPHVPIHQADVGTTTTGIHRLVPANNLQPLPLAAHHQAAVEQITTGIRQHVCVSRQLQPAILLPRAVRLTIIGITIPVLANIMRHRRLPATHHQAAAAVKNTGILHPVLASHSEAVVRLLKGAAQAITGTLPHAPAVLKEQLLLAVLHHPDAARITIGISTTVPASRIKQQLPATLPPKVVPQTNTGITQHVLVDLTQAELLPAILRHMAVATITIGIPIRARVSPQPHLVVLQQMVVEIIITGITTTVLAKHTREQLRLVIHLPLVVATTITGIQQVVCVNPVQTSLPAMPQVRVVELIPIGILTHVPVTPTIRITSKRILTG